MKDLNTFIKQIVNISLDKQADNIRCYQPEDQSVTDYILVMTVKNPVHGKAVLEDIRGFIMPFFQTDDEELSPLRVSGEVHSGWVILDMNSVILHLLLEETRASYELDQKFEESGAVYHY